MKVVASMVLLNLFGLVGLMIGTLVAEISYLAPYTFAMRRFLDLSASELAKPLWSIVAVAGVAAACHLAIRLLFQDNYVAIAVSAGAIFAGHTLINYRFLLQDNERSYLRQTLRIRQATE